MFAEPTPAYRSPGRHGRTCEEAAAWLAVPYVIDGVHVYVSDVEAHYARARKAGATILGELDDSLYRAADIEGHRWVFQAMPKI